MQTHETIASFRDVTVGSNRKFGITFSLLFAFLGIWPLIRSFHSPRWWLIVLSAIFLAAAYFRPNWLAPLNRAWFMLGLALNKVMSPIVMGILFFGVIVPIGWFVRKKGEDLLNLKIRPEANTYWIERVPPGPARGTLTKQY